LPSVNRWNTEKEKLLMEVQRGNKTIEEFSKEQEDEVRVWMTKGFTFHDARTAFERG